MSLRRDVDSWPDARALAEGLVDQAGGSVRLVLMYGSRLQKTNPDRHSALDLIVVVDDYAAFYRELAAAGELHRPVWLMRWLSGILPPNVIAYTTDAAEAALGKLLVVDQEHLERGLGPEPPDHFLLGRMVQEMGLVWWASDEDRLWIEARVGEAHRRVLDWMAPYLEGPVDAESLGRRLLEVCYSGEVRPESRSRADRVFEAQQDHLRRALAPTLEVGLAEGRLRREGDGYALVEAPSEAHRRRWRWHFRRSKVRTTLRWFKHMLTFANWLPYVRRKVERHSGRSIELTWLERKLPLVFLWPRAIFLLLTRPSREKDS